MRKHLAATLLVAATGLAACSTEPTAVATLEPAQTGLAAASGVSNPNTPVSGVVTILVNGVATYRSSGPSNNGLGTCQPIGVYYNPTTRKTSGKEHPQCLSVTASQEITITFAETANYVLPPNGNVQLNFSPDCTLSSDPLTCTRGIQYKKNQDVTIGSGRLRTEETTHGTGTWTIDLASQLLGGIEILNTSGNNIVRTGTNIVACNATLGCHPGVLTW